VSPQNPYPGQWFPPETDPGHEERSDEPKFSVLIVAHASPRWRASKDADDADSRNWKLSQQRSIEVHSKVEEILSDLIGSNTNVKIDDKIEIESEARGSSETLQEAKGNRYDNSPNLRRVNVIIQSDQQISGVAGASIERSWNTIPTKTRFWYINGNASMNVSEKGGTVGFLNVTLINSVSGQSMTGNIVFIGHASNVNPLPGASASIPGDPTSFYTNEQVDFVDFQDSSVLLKSVQITPLPPIPFGYEFAYLTFLAPEPIRGSIEIDISSWNVAMPDIGESITFGKLLLQGGYPPKTIPVSPIDYSPVPYERTKHEKDILKVTFSTGSFTLDPLNEEMLEVFIKSFIESKR
jgi:hypothetical protein